MTVRILDATTRAAVAAAPTQQEQCEALRDAFAGDVTLRIEGAGGQHLRTVTLGPFTVNSETPRGLVCGAVLADTAVAPTTPGAAGITPTRWEFRNGSVPIFDSDEITQGAIKALCQPMFGAVVFTAVPTLPVMPAPITTGEIAPQSKFWTQYSRPQAYTRNGATYFGWTDSSGGTGISKFTHATETLESFQLVTGSGTANGHDSCVISFAEDGRVVATWSVQNTSCFRRVSTNPEDISAWGSTATLSAVGETVSYANVWYLSAPNRWYLHYRKQDPLDSNHRFCERRVSTDGTTFGTSATWIDEPGTYGFPYVVSQGNGVNRIDFFFSSTHQVFPGVQMRLYHAYLLVASDGTESWYDSNGVSIGAGPIQPTTDATLVWDGTTEPGWPWDVQLGSDGKPRLLWVKQHGASGNSGSDDHRHMYSRLVSGVWTHTQIGSTAGQRLYSGEVWSTGALCFAPGDTARVYRSVMKTGFVWGPEEWRTSDDGATWSKHRDVWAVGTNPDDTVTPIAPYRGGSVLEMLAMRGDIRFWNDFDLAVWAAGRSD